MYIFSYSLSLSLWLSIVSLCRKEGENSIRDRSLDEAGQAFGVSDLGLASEPVRLALPLIVSEFLGDYARRLLKI